MTRDYIQNCVNTSGLRANLYTDIPEAEIIVDHLPTASIYLVNGIPISSYERAQETVHIHFVGKGKTTDVFTTNDLSSSLVTDALGGKPCSVAK